jgi:hypothetical protein
MLKILGFFFVAHVVVLGVFFGRRLDFTRMSRLGWVFAYLLLFYLGWGLFYSFLPEIIVPELPPP